MFCERNYGCRITEFSIYGHRAISMENRYLRVGILPGWGCQIYEFLDKQTDTDFMFRERRGLSRLNGYKPSREGPQGAFWDYMLGGWFEMFPNAGKTCVYNGLTYGQHGEVAYQPWDVELIEDTPEHISLKFSVETMRVDFRLERTMELYVDKPSLFLNEKLVNLSPLPQEYLWGHHFTMGEAFLNEHCVIDTPECVAVDRNTADVPASQLCAGAQGTLKAMTGKDGTPVDETQGQGKDSHISEMLYLREMQAHWLAISDRNKGVGVGLSWDGEAFPFAWIWKEFSAGKTFPFFGHCYGLSFEPCVTSVPIIENASKAGETQILEGHAEKTAWLTVSVHHEKRSVCGLNRDGNYSFLEECEV